jgi:hypothetical protein
MTTKPNGITSEELAAIRERAEKATPGPWIIDRVNGVIWSADGRRVFEIGGYEEPDDHEFFAHARDDIPRLLDEIERLQRRWDALKSFVQHKVETTLDDGYRWDFEQVLSQVEMLEKGE